MKRSLLSFNFLDLQNYLVERKFAKYSSKQIFDWVYKKKIFDLTRWSNVAKKFKIHIEESLTLQLPEIVRCLESKDGTVKFLMSMEDKQTVETVIIPGKDRYTLCISSQVGCAIGCTFCNTGTMGFVRHLATSEIVGQFMAASLWLESEREADLTNIVFMGQGEPMHNYDNVKKAVEIFMEPLGFGIGQRRITVSTVGLVPQLKRLSDFPPVNIAISLHATRDEVRNKLMPINEVHNISGILEALKQLRLKPNRAITFEYLLIEGVNDGNDDLLQLTKLLDKRRDKINLIPFNPFEGSPYRSPCEERIIWFKNELLSKGYVCTVRISKGQDIMAACGQLKSNS